MHNGPRYGAKNIPFVWVFMSETQIRDYSGLILLDSVTMPRVAMIPLGRL